MHARKHGGCSLSNKKGAPLWCLCRLVPCPPGGAWPWAHLRDTCVQRAATPQFNLPARAVPSMLARSRSDDQHCCVAGGHELQQRRHFCLLAHGGPNLDPMDSLFAAGFAAYPGLLVCDGRRRVYVPLQGACPHQRYACRGVASLLAMHRIMAAGCHLRAGRLMRGGIHAMPRLHAGQR